jgi:acyl transferase domain-containing protein
VVTEISPGRWDADEYYTPEPGVGGVVGGTAANKDGHTVNIATTSPNARTAVCRAALAAAGVDTRSVGIAEVYGTEAPARWPQ